jgi:hypothetical protein
MLLTKSVIVRSYEERSKAIQSFYNLLYLVYSAYLKGTFVFGYVNPNRVHSKMSFFSIHRIITDLKSQIFITAGHDLRKKSASINYLKGRIFDCALSSTFQVVTGIGYLPQVATCGYENQALRAAKMYKITLHEKKRHFGIRPPNSLSSY